MVKEKPPQEILKGILKINTDENPTYALGGIAKKILGKLMEDCLNPWKHF